RRKMSREERIQVANQALSEPRKPSYSECRAMTKSALNRSAEREGKEFQVEIQALWDDKQCRNVRILIAVSEPGISDFFPRNGCLHYSRDGCFVGEDRCVKPSKS